MNENHFNHGGGGDTMESMTEHQTWEGVESGEGGAIREHGILQ